MCAEVTWGDFGSLCHRNNRGGCGEALQAAGQGGCAFWRGSWSRTERGNMFPSDRELCLVMGCPHSQQEEPREDEQRLSQARSWQGELSATQRLPPLTSMSVGATITAGSDI